jgi:hypothetical protein
MSIFLPIAVLIPTAVVVAAVSLILWHAAASKAERKVALVATVSLTVWSVLSTTFAYRGFFQPQTVSSVPPIGIYLAGALLFLTFSLLVSPSLRRLLSDQTNLTRLHVWRLEGIVFLLLMVLGRMPALWALPAGIGDILVGVSAFRVAGALNAPGGRRRAIIFNLLGMTDLIVAVGLGITTNPGPLHLFHTTPTSALITGFPLALVPTFLVPLAFTIHVISLWQLLGFKWASQPQVSGPATHPNQSRGYGTSGRRKKHGSPKIRRSAAYTGSTVRPIGEARLIEK